MATCQDCGKQLRSKKYLKSHLAIHSTERPFTCTLCPQKFKLRTILTSHIRVVHSSELPYPCPQCPKRFGQKNGVTSHLLTHSKADMKPCPECGKLFRAKYLPLHVRRHMGPLPLEFECTICYKLFSYKCSLTTHMRIHTGEKPFVCAECPESFRQSAYLDAHRREKHTHQMFRCNHCPKVFNTKNNLKGHVRLHTGISRFMCTLCSHAAHSSKSLQIHMTIHTKERAFKCEVCDKTFTTKGGLTLHSRRHLKKIFHCPYCDYKSLIEQRLESHIRRHVVETILQCPHCPYSATTVGGLKRHLETHGIKRRTFECDICFRKLRHKNSLVYHKRTHSGYKEHQCPFCQAKFTHPSTYRRHLKQMHTNRTSKVRQMKNGNLKIKCSKCICKDAVFTSRSKLLQHQKSEECTMSRLPTQELRICLKRIDD